MKKIYILMIVFLACFFVNIDCYASVNTYDRTDSNLRLPEGVTVDSSNINDIKNTASVSSSEKIYDFADLLTVKEEEKLYKKINEFVTNNNVDLIILTTSDMNNYSIADYTYNFYQYNDFKKDAIVFTVFMNTKEPEIYMDNHGKKISSVFTNDVMNDILEYVYQNIFDGKYYDALSNYIKIVDGFYNIDQKGGGSYKVDDFGNLVKQIPWIEIIILASTLTFVVVSCFIYLIKGKNKINNESINLERNVDNSTMIVKCDNDSLIDVSDSQDK